MVALIATGDEAKVRRFKRTTLKQMAHLMAHQGILYVA
jgi:hypothetical protein